MRWIFPISGLISQLASVACYFLFLEKAKIKIFSRQNFANGVSKKNAFHRIFVASGILWALGTLALMTFALIDRDPVLLFFELFIAASLFLLFIKPRI